jgi:putative transposase
VANFVAKHAGLEAEDGRARVVRRGHLAERDVRTGIGPVALSQPRSRPWHHRRRCETHPLDADDPSTLRAPLADPGGSEPLPCFKGIATSDLEEALAALLEGRTGAVGEYDLAVDFPG